MSQSMSISLPEDVWAQVEALAREDGVSVEHLIRTAVGDYLFLRQFRALRAKMVPHAQAQGIFTDEDVFERM